ncbi:MAG: hypothetical protein VX000_09390, partial [Myxococcota bacterium]|nr:hypothetical protein [Myxococcota bacterium]
MGVPAYDTLYADYAARRWGAPGRRLGASLARRHHFIPDAAPRVLAAGGTEEVFAALAERIQADGEVRTGVAVERFHVEGGRVRGVVLRGGETVESDGVWVEDTPARAVRWLGEAASAGLVVDAGRLPAAGRARVGLHGVDVASGEVVHLLDEGLSGWRVTGLGEGAAVVDCTLDAPPGPALAQTVAAEVREAGLGDARPDGGPVEWERHAVALWEVTTPAVLREVLGPLAAAGVVMVGARGAVADLGPGEALALALHFGIAMTPAPNNAVPFSTACATHLLIVHAGSYATALDGLRLRSPTTAAVAALTAVSVGLQTTRALAFPIGLPAEPDL